jgi:hypothetical protein
VKNLLAKLAARRFQAAAARKRPAPAPADRSGACEPAVCELCESDWGALRPDEIAELLVASGRFPEEQREALLALPRELLVSVFCGCSAKLRLAPPLPSAPPARRQAAP